MKLKSYALSQLSTFGQNHDSSSPMLLGPEGMVSGLDILRAARIPRYLEDSAARAARKQLERREERNGAR